MTGNGKSASEDEFNELRIGVICAYDKLRSRLDSATAKGWIGDVKALDRMISKLVDEPSNKGKVSLTLDPFRTGIPLNATKPKAMAELFHPRIKVRYFSSRSPSLDSWFAPKCLEGKRGTYRIVTTAQVSMVKAMAQSATRKPVDSITDLSRAISSKGIDISPVQFEEILIATENGEDIFRKAGWTNFAFTKTGKVLKDEKGDYEEIVVLLAACYDGEWKIDVARLHGEVERAAGVRLILRNKI